MRRLLIGVFSWELARILNREIFNELQGLLTFWP